MRRGLAAHLGAAAGDLQFVYGPTGKPELVPERSGGLAFSLSHARNGIVLAVAAAARVGVDLEPLARASTVLKIARRSFSEAEMRSLEARGEGAELEALALWGLKESVVKAAGRTIWEGVSAVSFALDSAAVRWCSPPPCGQISEWFLMCARYPGDCSLALAVQRDRSITLPQRIVVHTLAEPPGEGAALATKYASGPATTHSSFERFCRSDA